MDELAAQIPDRLERARQELINRGVDVALFTASADFRYLTGYDAHPTERMTCLVVTATGDPAIVVPQLEEPLVAASPAGQHGIQILPWQETDRPGDLVANLVPTSGRRTVAVADRMWAEHVFALSESLNPTSVTGAGNLMAALRMCKSPAETRALAEAGAAIDEVHGRMGELLRVGRTEREVGADIATAILRSGHAVSSFAIVGSGPNGASPHHHLSDRVIDEGDIVVVDIGGQMPSGYCSDSTRTYIVGAEPPARFTDYYDVLMAAHQGAVTAARPGVTAQDVDAAAREVISEGGYGEYFIHRTGHGIGLEGHEHPYIVSGNTMELQAGMAFSIEPGIYLPGEHGARIEDIAICTEDGVDLLNTRPRAVGVLAG